MSAAGLEPATNGLKGHCSTIELRAPIEKHSIMSGSDRQPDTILSNRSFIRNLQEPASALDFF